MSKDIVSAIYGTDGVDADKVPNTPAELEEAKKTKSGTANADVSKSMYRPTSILVNAAALQHVEEPGFCDNSCEIMAQEMLTIIQGVYQAKAEILKTKLAPPKELPPFVIAIMVLKKFNFVAIMPDDSNTRESGFLAFYDGNKKSHSYGLYVTDTVRMDKIFSFFHGDLKKRDREEIMNYIRGEAPTRRVDTTQDIAPFANGVYNYDTGEFKPYSPDQTHLFKFATKWNPDAEMPVIEQEDGTVWRPDEWLESLFGGDEELALSMWQVIGAHLRPYNSFDQAAILMSPKGSNGKGTLLQLIESLVGSHNTAHIPLDAMEQRFGMHRVIGKCAVIADENNVGAYHTSARNFKALVTADTLTIDRKNRSVVDYRPFVQVTQCFNDNLRVADDSDSLFRRQLFIPFPQTFLDSKRNPAIREDYVKRPEVLEWVAKHVLLEIPSYKRFTESTASKELKIEQKLVNSPIREFIDENYDSFVHDFIPLKCLYQIYKAWYADTVSDRGKAASKKAFTNELRRVIDENPEYGWEAPANKRMQTSKFKSFDASSEPLVEQYKGQDRKLQDMYWHTKGPGNPLKVPASGLIEGLWVNHTGPRFRKANPMPPMPPILPAKLDPVTGWPISYPPVTFDQPTGTDAPSTT
ncbi:DNA primase family protein [Corynebacterium tuberculostearicum]|uniref:Phage/plasmid primase, P4 family domain protein n=1 Tax=Corynebacterium tuberculostearicum SK141 TaxID=553206 RepID=C6R691_9CORY|nr:phage/plasmid primase, P4 family [Corynebacterium tuberculostearicum]EET78473.1 phage/plasmid primase, P4 family domain protein [Corynebacterium tuberculostearicum SK141]